MRGQHIDDNSHNMIIIIISNQDQENTPMRLRINTLLIKPVLAGSGYLLNPVIEILHYSSYGDKNKIRE